MIATEYRALYEQEERLWWFVGMRRLVDDLLAAYRHPGLRCIEAGCGAGFNAVDLSRRYGWQVFPCDHCVHALRFTAQRGVPRLAAADVARLPYAAASFDLVTSFDVLELLTEEQVKEALREF